MARASSVQWQQNRAESFTAAQVSLHRACLHSCTCSCCSLDSSDTRTPAPAPLCGPLSRAAVGVGVAGASTCMMMRSIVNSTSSAATATSCSSQAACSASLHTAMPSAQMVLNQLSASSRRVQVRNTRDRPRRAMTRVSDHCLCAVSLLWCTSILTPFFSSGAMASSLDHIACLDRSPALWNKGNIMFPNTCCHCSADMMGACVDMAEKRVFIAQWRMRGRASRESRKSLFSMTSKTSAT
mmetsp:Transcript_29994/g.66373  ORF Transcript_29994/g.66373 Transcript_29994/m.66373 type:complete len:240 (-) Transcript_29994:74-793(-)